MPVSKRINRLSLARALFWVGASAGGLVITYEVYAQSGQALYISWLAVIGLVIGTLCGPMAGWAADRFSFRLTVLAPLIIGSLTFLLYTRLDLADPWQVIPIAAGAGILGCTFGPGLAVLTVKLAGDRQGWAAARVTSADLFGQVLGPILGGAAATQNSDLALILASVILLTSLLVFASLRGEEALAEGPDRAVGSEAGWLGWKLVRNHPVLWAVLLSALILITARQFAILAEAPLIQDLGGDALSLAVLSALYCLGGAIGARLIENQLGDSAAAMRMMRWGRALQILPLGLLVVLESLWGAVAVYFFSGLAGAAASAASRALVARESPHDAVGRVTTLQASLGNVSSGLALVAGGWLIDAYSARAAFALTFVLGMASLLPLLTKRSRRKLQSAD